MNAVFIFTKMLYEISYTFFLLPFIIPVSGQNIIPTAKEEIYKTIITIEGQNDIIWINETIDWIYNYDVDGNYEK